MTDRTWLKITVKIFDDPLIDNELDEYAESKRLNITRFTNSTFLLGEISDGKEHYGVLGLDREKWIDKSLYNPDYDLIDRISIKLYDKSGKMVGRTEERLIKELSRSTEPIFSTYLKTLPYVLDIEKESDKLMFSLLTNRRKGILEIFQITKKSFKLRTNFTVKTKFLGQEVASIDAKWGGKFEIKIFDEDLANNVHFLDFLILFTGTIKFHGEIEDKINLVSSEISRGMMIIKPSETAVRLLSEAYRGKLLEKETGVTIDLLGKAKPRKVKEKEVRKPKDMDLKKVKKKKHKKEKVEKPPEKEEIVKSPKEIKIEDLIKKEVVEKPPAKVEVEELAKKEVTPKPTEVVKKELPKKKEVKKPPAKVEVKKPPKKEVVIKPLYLEDSVKKIEGIPKDISKLLVELGIDIVDDLIFVDAGAIADFIGIKEISRERIKQLQDLGHKQVKATIKKDKIDKTKYLQKLDDHSK